MSQLKIKGVSERVYVEESQAKMIDDILSNPEKRKQNPYLKVGKWSGFVSDITGVFHDNEKKNYNEKTDKMNEDYNAWRKRFQSLSLEERSKDVQLFTFLFLAYNNSYDKKPNIEMLEKVKEIQYSFFKSNPLRCFCDLSLFITLLGHIQKNKVISPYSKALFNIIERQVAEDMTCARYNH